MSIAYSWGVTPEEKEMRFPCDDLGTGYDPSCTLFRGITIEARPDIIYKWLCQMRIAAYSYDFIDKESPKILLSNQPALAVGQTMMDLFEVIKFETNRHITLKIKHTYFQIINAVVCYYIVPIDNRKCRLLLKGYTKYKPGLLGYISKTLMPWGDLIMMRKQFLNIKYLAEKSS